MNEKILKWTSVILLGLTLGLSAVVVKIENQRYALLVGVCPSGTEFHEALLAKGPSAIGDAKTDPAACLKNVQTRTSPLWHIFYAIENTLE
jgi:hypothetical protein